MRIVADIGGTNTRLAWAKAGEIDQTTLQNFSNDSLSDFLSALCTFQGDQTVDEVVLAVAAPVANPERDITLTNRNWTISPQAISAQTGGKTMIINDLCAAGLALPALAPHQLRPLYQGEASGTQRLVVGMGTGFNVSPVIDTTPLSVEAGHVSMPFDIMIELNTLFGQDALTFNTIESLFSGSGFWTFCRLFLQRPGADEAAMQADPRAGEARRFFMRIFAKLLRHMAQTYMPSGGMYLTGGVIRGMVATMGGEVINAYSTERLPVTNAPMPPVYLITDDAAGLIGAARAQF